MIVPLLALVLAVQEPQEEKKRPEIWLPALKTVTLPKAKRPVGEIVEEIRRQTGLKVEASGIEDADAVEVEWNDRPVLEALDDVCRALGRGRIRSPWSTGKGDEPTLELNGSADRPPAVSHWKQFQVEVSDVRVTIVRSLKETKRTAQITLQVSGQPGVRPMGMGGFVAEEAVDDTGWSLLTRSGSQYYHGRNQVGTEAGENPNVVEFVSRHRSFGRSGQGRSVSVSLRAPADDAKKIERLTGRISMSFPMRYVDETVPVTLLEKGTEVRIGAMKVHFTKFEQKGQKVTLVYQVPQTGEDDDFPSFPDFELVDADGNRLSGGSSGSGGGTGYTMTYRLSKDVRIAGVRYRAYVGRVTIVMPVELRDIPIPQARRP